MVTKPVSIISKNKMGLILAKNHMVTKPLMHVISCHHCLILAKNHMVTKLYTSILFF